VEITVGMFLLLFALAFVCEFIDSSLGMGYGTIMSPLLIILGFEPLIVIPAILLSQAFGGFTAAVFHHQFENASFKPGSRDLKIVMIISGFGFVATVAAALLALHIPKVVLKTYIGVLVLVMGGILLSNRTFRFSWKKMIGVGILSAFNKGMTGGGFGPVVTSDLRADHSRTETQGRHRGHHAGGSAHLHRRFSHLHGRARRQRH